jgi:hypothetical protein
MEAQKEFEVLRPSRTFSVARNRRNPVFWIRRLDVLRDLEGTESSVVRTMRLRRGLNVLWAKPEDASLPTELYRGGISGHASGKTTFCRLLRFILGERHFSSESIRQLIRERFPAGWVVAEVVIGEEEWLVKRPIGIGRQSFAARSATYEDLLAAETPWEVYQGFIDALSDSALAHHAVTRFASSDDRIGWLHLLPWLTRDQECRYSKLVVWRDASSQSDTPNLSDDDRAYLVRVVLDMLSEREQAELAKLATLHNQRDEAEATAPKLEHEARSYHQTLTEEYGEELPSLADSLFLDQIIGRLSAERKILDEQFSKIPDEPALELAKLRQKKAIEVRSRADASVEALTSNLKQATDAAEVLRHNASQQAQVDYYASLPDPADGVCKISLQAAADLGCPVALKKVENQKTVDFTTRSVDQGIRTERESLESHLAALKAQLDKANAVFAAAQAEEMECARQMQSLDEKQQQTMLVRKRAGERLSQLQWIADRARAAHDAAENERKNIVNLTKEIENTKKTAEAIREDFKRVMSDFSTTFNRVIAALIGDDVSAGASFHGRTVQVNLTCRGDFTSAAIETIKILAFDLAVLASSIEGRGHHPRFLVHDGPREADMSAAIYRRFFILAREYERAANGAEPNFQYIITTTEPPPDEIRTQPWLLDPVLDASTQDGRLLKADL